MMTSAVDNTRSSALPTESNIRPFGILRQWEPSGRNQDGKHKIAGLLFGHRTLPDGKMFTVYLPPSSNTTRLRKGDNVTCFHGHVFQLGEKRDNGFESLSSRAVERNAGEAPPVRTWKPPPGQQRLTGHQALDDNGTYTCH